MTARLARAVRLDAGMQAILAAAIVGAGLVFAAGFANSAGLHAAAHDARHAAGFPCH